MPQQGTMMIRPGLVHLGHQNLTPECFKRIVLKLREVEDIFDNFDAPQPPSKTRRLEPSVKAILQSIGTKCAGGGLTSFNVFGNEMIGDAGMKHLHLLPYSVTHLDLSDCGLSVAGIQMVCEFMKTRPGINRLLMWGNEVGDEGAKHIADMLVQNHTLQDLCIMKTDIGVEGMKHLARALKVNKTLHKLDLYSMNLGDFTDDHLKELCAGLAQNEGLEKLDISGNEEITEGGLVPLEEALRTNYTVESVELSVTPPIFRYLEEGKDWIQTGPGSNWKKICQWMYLNKQGRKKMK